MDQTKQIKNYIKKHSLITKEFSASGSKSNGQKKYHIKQKQSIGSQKIPLKSLSKVTKPSKNVT